MNIENKPCYGYCVNPRTGEQVENDSGIDQVFCDGQCVGYIMGRKPTDCVSLIGIPSEALLASLKDKYPDRYISAPTVLLNKDGDPIGIYGDVDEEDEDDSPEDDDDE